MFLFFRKLKMEDVNRRVMFSFTPTGSNHLKGARSQRGAPIVWVSLETEPSHLASTDW